MGWSSSRSSVVRFGRAKSSRTTRSVHLSPINCSAPAIGQPSILRRRTRRITRFRAELITISRDPLRSILAALADISLWVSVRSLGLSGELFPKDFNHTETEILQSHRDLTPEDQFLEISRTLHHNALAFHASIRLTNCNFPPNIREHDRQNHFTLSRRRKAR